MTVNEQIVALINRTSKIISSMKVDDVNFETKQEEIDKSYLQKLLTIKLDLEDFMKKFNELLLETNKLYSKADTKNLLTLLENNKTLIINNKNQFEALLNKINLLLEQLKLNKELSKFIK